MGIRAHGADVETDILTETLHNVTKVHAGVQQSDHRIEQLKKIRHTSMTRKQDTDVHDVQKYALAVRRASCLRDLPA